MKVNIIKGGGDAARAILYGPPSQEDQAYFAKNLEAIASTTTGSNSMFQAVANNLYQKYSSQQAINTAQNLLFSAQMTVSDEQIYPISPTNIKQANNIMKRWIMTTPEVAELYDRQNCNGFNDSVQRYDDHEYAKATDGFIRDVEGGFEATEVWIDETDPDEKVYGYYEQVSIQHTFETAKHMILNGIDPTSEDLDDL